VCQIAARDGRARELRLERDASMASVRQRDAALQASTANPDAFDPQPRMRTMD
jgi:hypothetical protein